MGAICIYRKSSFFKVTGIDCQSRRPCVCPIMVSSLAKEKKKVVTFREEVLCFLQARKSHSFLYQPMKDHRWKFCICTTHVSVGKKCQTQTYVAAQWCETKRLRNSSRISRSRICVSRKKKANYKSITHRVLTDRISNLHQTRKAKAYSVHQMFININNFSAKIDTFVSISKQCNQAGV